MCRSSGTTCRRAWHALHPSLAHHSLPTTSQQHCGSVLYSGHGGSTVCTYVCMYVRIYVCMYVCMYVRMYVCMYVRMYACFKLTLSSVQAGSFAVAELLGRSITKHHVRRGLIREPLAHVHARIDDNTRGRALLSTYISQPRVDGGCLPMYTPIYACTYVRMYVVCM